MRLRATVWIPALAAAGLMLSACSEADAARVDCGTPGPNGVDCNIQRTGGKTAFEACWDLIIACQNGGEMTGAACGEVAAEALGGTQNMPVASFSNQEGCDVPASGRVENLKVTSK